MVTVREGKRHILARAAGVASAVLFVVALLLFAACVARLLALALVVMIWAVQ